jgi:hypothetical protein
VILQKLMGVFFMKKALGFSTVLFFSAYLLFSGTISCAMGTRTQDGFSHKAVGRDRGQGFRPAGDAVRGVREMRLFSGEQEIAQYGEKYMAPNPVVVRQHEQRIEREFQRLMAMATEKHNKQKMLLQEVRAAATAANRGQVPQRVLPAHAPVHAAPEKAPLPAIAWAEEKKSESQAYPQVFERDMAREIMDQEVLFIKSLEKLLNIKREKKFSPTEIEKTEDTLLDARKQYRQSLGWLAVGLTEKFDGLDGSIRLTTMQNKNRNIQNQLDRLLRGGR